jgi:hypothetical protein
MVESVFIRDADCAVDLMRDKRDFARRFRSAYLRRCYSQKRIFSALDGTRSGKGGRNGCGDLPGGAGELLLDRLELPDPASELHAALRILDRKLQRTLERSGDQERAAERTSQT